MSQARTPEQINVILDQAMQPYLRKGWILQSRTPTQAQLLKRAKKYGCLARIFFGLWLLFTPRHDRLLLLSVQPNGKVTKRIQRAN